MAHQQPESEFALVLRLLDHQIIGPEGELLGNVDDILIEQAEQAEQSVQPGQSGQSEQAQGQWVVCAVMTGPSPAAQRQGGRLGRWLDASWRRLHPDADPVPLAVPFEDITDVDSAVHVNDGAARALAQSQGLELWLREHVISRLPGVLDGDDDHHGHLAMHRERHPDYAPGREARPMSRLLGAQVTDDAGASLGHVIEVTATVDRGGTGAFGTVTLDSLVCSTSHLGNELGYTLTPQGPWVVRRLVQALHRGDRRVLVADVDLTAALADRPAGESDRQQLTLRSGATTAHPYDPR